MQIIMYYVNIQGLIPKEDESLDSIDNAVEDEITSTAEVCKHFILKYMELSKYSA